MQSEKMARGAQEKLSMSRFFVEPDAVGKDIITISDENNVHHLSGVLRLRPGDEIDVSDSHEWEYHCMIEYVGDYVEARILDKQRFAAEPRLNVTLFQGIPKQGKMDLTVQKTVELGVSQIVPVYMARTVVTDKGNFWKRMVRFRSIAEEAAKQCGRGIIPEIRQECKIEEIYERFSRFDMVIFPYENERKTTIKDLLRGNPKVLHDIAIVIGPEGGFADEEAAKIIEAGGKSCSLGKTILRTETAGLAALAMVMYELELF